MPRYEFKNGVVPDAFRWLHPPARYEIADGLHVDTAPDTDFWQRTHYGFIRDTGHALLTKVQGDFSLETQVRFAPTAQYDQCGLLLRVDAENWLKVSTEFEHATHSRLGSVVTNLGYSDWATQDIAGECNAMAYRVQRDGADVLIESRQTGADWAQMRIAHLHAADEGVEVGVYACSPVGPGFGCVFEYVEIGDSRWSAHG